MHRRDALKSLAALAGVAGISVTPVTTHEATDVTMVVFRIGSNRLMSASQREHFLAAWKLAAEGTALEHVKAVVLMSDVEVEFVRGHL